MLLSRSISLRYCCCCCVACVFIITDLVAFSLYFMVGFHWPAIWPRSTKAGWVREAPLVLVVATPSVVACGDVACEGSFLRIFLSFFLLFFSFFFTTVKLAGGPFHRATLARPRRCLWPAPLLRAALACVVAVPRRCGGWPKPPSCWRKKMEIRPWPSPV